MSKLLKIMTSVGLVCGLYFSPTLAAAAFYPPKQLNCQISSDKEWLECEGYDKQVLTINDESRQLMPGVYYFSYAKTEGDANQPDGMPLFIYKNETDEAKVVLQAKCKKAAADIQNGSWKRESEEDSSNYVCTSTAEGCSFVQPDDVAVSQ